MNEIVELLKKILASSAQHKEIMNTDEAAEFLGKSRSYIDSLKTRRHIPFYKSETGSCYFKRDELIAWATAIKCETEESINAKAALL